MQFRSTLNRLRQVVSRRSMLVLAGVFSCIYALTVLSSVPFIPDLGLRTLFGPTLRGIAPGFVVSEVDAPVPKEGDTVTHVGPIEIRVWPDLLKAPFDIQLL